VVSWYVLFLDIFLSVLFYSVLFFLCIPELECNHSSSQPGRVKLGTVLDGWVVVVVVVVVSGAWCVVVRLVCNWSITHSQNQGMKHLAATLASH
jgi:hypothetical protein